MALEYIEGRLLLDGRELTEDERSAVVESAKAGYDEAFLTHITNLMENVYEDDETHIEVPVLRILGLFFLARLLWVFVKSIRK